MIDQLTVFLENKEGRLAALCRALADEDINMIMLTIAEVADYGLVRIICNDTERAVRKLDEAGFRAMSTKVVAVEVPNRPGGLAELLEAIDKLDVNVEYGYCFNISETRSVDVFKIKGHETVADDLRAAGFALLSQEELF
ncbi:MAG: amino acid-binding protein [Eggerthellaceae bacterium]|nr:amino acid-binding protein [Eggerthellaceae bacterium]